MHSKRSTSRLPPVVVLDAEQRAALAVVRSLGHRGVPVITASHIPSALAAASRFSSGHIVLPPPASDVEGYLAKLAELSYRGQLWPTTDLSVTLAACANLPAGSVVATPPAAQYRKASRKDLLFQLAQSCGVPVPFGSVAATVPDVISAALDIGFPVVLKPAASKVLIGGRLSSTRVQVVDNESDLAKATGEMDWLTAVPCIVQRWVPGKGEGIFALRWNGRVLAWFAHRRVREKPPTGGVSVLSESVTLDAKLRSYAEILLDRLDWQGVAMIEFRREPNGQPWLMEINGRFWGSLQLAIDSGVDFPWMYYQCIVGEQPFEATEYDVGRKLRWFLGDVDSLLISLRRGCVAPQTRFDAINQFASSFFCADTNNEVLRADDLRPAIREFGKWMFKRS